jgi:hypothetical protein
MGGENNAQAPWAHVERIAAVRYRVLGRHYVGSCEIAAFEQKRHRVAAI